MKVKMLSLAIAATIAAPAVALADGPTVYGRLNVSYEMVDVDMGNFLGLADSSITADNWQLISNNSRFGVRGDAAINDSLKAIYQIEWGVSADGDGTDLSARDRFVGLAGDFGTVQVGRIDTPLRKAQGKVDLFNDLSGDLENVFVGENRANNALQYSSPKMGALQANLMFQPGEEYDFSDMLDDPQDGPADAISASLVFEDQGFYGAVAYDSNVGSTARNGVIRELTPYLDLDEPDVEEAFGLLVFPARFDTLRLVGQFRADAFQFGAMFQTAKADGKELGDLEVEQDGLLLSAGFSAGANLFKIQYAQSATEFSVGSDSLEVDATSIGVGVDHSLTKQTQVFAYYNSLTYDYDLSGIRNITKDNLGVGIIHNF